MYCGKCGTEMDDCMNFCPKCGTEISEERKNHYEEESNTLTRDVFVQQKKKNKTHIVGIAVVAVLVFLAAGVGLSLFDGNDGDQTSGADSSEVSNKTVVLESEDEGVDQKSYAYDYFKENILPLYKDQPEELQLTYYTQTYRDFEKNERFFKHNLFKLDELNCLLIAYNIADYDGNGEVDLLTVTLEEDKGNLEKYDYSNITGIDNIKPMVLLYYIYFFDDTGHVRKKETGKQSLAYGFSEDVLNFSFYEDKIILLENMDASGNIIQNIFYPTLDDVLYHLSLIYGHTYNLESDDIQLDVGLGRYLYEERVEYYDLSLSDKQRLIYDSKENDGSVATEGEAISKCEEILTQKGIYDIEIPLSNWEERWLKDFYIRDDSDYNVFTLVTEPTVSIKYNSAGPIFEKGGVAIGNLVGTTTGTVTFKISGLEGL